MKKLFIVFQVTLTPKRGEVSKSFFNGIYEKESDALNRIMSDTTGDIFCLCGVKLNEYISNDITDFEFAYYPQNDERPIIEGWESFE